MILGANQIIGKSCAESRGVTASFRRGYNDNRLFHKAFCGKSLANWMRALHLSMI